jgi:hypothetical protein
MTLVSIGLLIQAQVHSQLIIWEFLRLIEIYLRAENCSRTMEGTGELNMPRFKVLKPVSNYLSFVSRFKERDQPHMPGIDDILDAQYLLYQFFYIVGDRENAYNLMLDIRNIWPSRLLNALPGTFDDAQTAALGEIADVFQPNATREIPWLQQNGRCMDHIVPGTSTLENSGHGAFVKRFLPKGTVISGSPLIHMFEDVLETYDLVYSNDTATRRRPWTKNGHQVLLNYCFGYHESTLLLCPYGSGKTAITQVAVAALAFSLTNLYVGVNYINHNASLANVRIQWAPNGTIGHNSSWLSLTPKEMEWNYKQSLGTYAH